MISHKFSQIYKFTDQYDKVMAFYIQNNKG